MLKEREISALILVALVIWTTLYLEPVWFVLISSSFILLGIWEWFKLFSNRDMRGIYIIFIVFPILFMFIIWPSISFILSVSSIRTDSLQSKGIFYLFYVFVMVFWISYAPVVIHMYQTERIDNLSRKMPGGGILPPKKTTLKSFFLGNWTHNGWKITLCSINPKLTLKNFFLGNCLLWGMWLTLIILLVKNPYILLFLFLIIWSADTAAYFVGKKYGKHSLAHNVSPGKTWEGVAGGLIAAILTSFLTLYLFKKFSGVNLFEASQLKIILLSSITVIYSVIGDLFISVVKRETGNKNSGVLIPGHGGILDRIDSLMAGSVAFMSFGAFFDLFGFAHYGL